METAVQETLEEEVVKVSVEEMIERNLVEIQEMIAFLDYSFERAFTMNEKNYILAYKTHAVKIQDDIDKMRNETFNQQLQMETKNKKIDEFASRLASIKTSALFMGEMSEFHAKAMKDLNGKDRVNEDEIRFLEEMLHKERVESRANRQ